MRAPFILRPKPTLLVTKPKKTEEEDHTQIPDLTLEQEVKGLLFRYEAANMRRVALKEQNAELFEKLDELDREEKEVCESMKRLLHTKDGPPSVVPVGKSSHVWAKGERYYVEVAYKKKADYYDPKKLPDAVFKVPGVVVEVDRDKLDSLGKKDKRIGQALVKGAWMTPSLTIRRATKDNQTSDE